MVEKIIALPKLNNISPTLESTTIKLMEELGELAELIGKLRGMNGEEVNITESEIYELIAGELYDVAQTSVSMMFVLEEVYNVNLDRVHKNHITKLQRKKYLVLKAS